MGLDVNATGQSDPVNRSGPVGPQVTIEQSVLLGMKTVETENTPVGPVGLDVNSAGRGELVCRPGIGGLQNRTEWTERTEWPGWDTPPGGHIMNECRTRCGSADGWWPGSPIV